MASSKSKDSAVTQKALTFQIRESYKVARTNIDYSIIKKGCKKIAFTSTAKSEGKTITAMNIALALAQHPTCSELHTTATGAIVQRLQSVLFSSWCPRT